MSLHRLAGYSAAAMLSAGFVLASLTPTDAFMPAPRYDNPLIQKVDCAVGAHIGPLGGCILGTDDSRPPDAVGPRDVNGPGCETRSVTRSDSDGNSETKTKTDC
jgi:hypothetical protein